MGFRKENIAAALTVFFLLQFAHASHVFGSSKLPKNEAPASKEIEGQSNLDILGNTERKLEENVETGNPITLPTAARPTKTSVSNGKSKNTAWVEPPVISDSIPIRFHKDREFVSYVPIKTATKKSAKSGSFMRSRRSYQLPGSLDLSRLLENGNNMNEEKDEFVSEIERERERQRFLQFVALLAVKDSNANGLSDADFDTMDDEDEVPIDLMHYDPYSSIPKRKQKQRNGKGQISNKASALDETISLMSSHPGNVNRGPGSNKRKATGHHASHLMTPSSDNEDNDGEWFDETIPIHRHSIKRSGNFRSHTPTILQRGLFSIPIGSEERNAENQAFFESLRQFPFTRQADSAMNSRALKSNGDGLYSLNQLLSDSQGVDPRLPIYQRVIL